MWSQRITSGSEKHPIARDVFASLLYRLMDKKAIGSWAHFETVSEGGWFVNLFSGKQPWLEVGYGQDFLELNCGVPKSHRSAIPQLPVRWREKSGIWMVPHQDADELSGWLEKCLTAVSSPKAFKVSGWIEGE